MAFNIPIPIYSIPIPSHPHSHFLTYSHSHGIPVWAIPIPSHSHSVNAKVVYNYNIFLITEILIIYYHYTKNVRIRTRGRINYISVVGKLGTIGIDRSGKYSTNNLISSSQHKTFVNKFPWECR